MPRLKLKRPSSSGTTSSTGAKGSSRRSGRISNHRIRHQSSSSREQQQQQQDDQDDNEISVQQPPTANNGAASPPSGGGNTSTWCCCCRSDRVISRILKTTLLVLVLIRSALFLDTTTTTSQSNFLFNLAATLPTAEVMSSILDNPLMVLPNHNQTITLKMPNHQEEEEEGEFVNQTLIAATIVKWDLPNTPKIHSLLERVWLKNKPYDPQRDLIVFYHPLKTGGTTVSTLLEDLFGKHAVVPGSHASGHFGYKVWEQHVQANSKTPQHLAKYKVLFSHNYYRSHYRKKVAAAGDGGEQQHTQLYNMLHQWFVDNGNNDNDDASSSRRRIRQITMVRDPVAFVASNYNEWFCKLHKWTKLAEAQQIPKKFPLKSEYLGCHGYTLEELAQARRNFTIESCQHLTPQQIKRLDPGVIKVACQQYSKSGGTVVDAFPECASTGPALFQSHKYEKHFHNHPSYSQAIVGTATHEQFESSIEYLAGLEGAEGATSAGTTTNNANNVVVDDDMIWFGITERMKESICLLHYQLKLPWKETHAIKIPKKRVHACSPTKYWSTAHQEQLRQKETIMMIVHQVANAILDIQIAKMKYEVMQMMMQQQGQQQEQLPSYINADCLL